MSSFGVSSGVPSVSVTRMSLTRLLYLLPGYRSRYSDWVRAGRPRGRSSSPGRGKIFLFFTPSRPVPGPTQPPIQCIPRALSSGVKRPGSEADHSPQTIAEVNNTWIYTSTPPYAFMS
jgi:hypothetical protein